MLVLSDVAAKALGQVQSFVTQLLAARMPEPQAAALAKALYQSAIYEVLIIDLNALRHQRST